jgi:hypothetical protein
MLHERQNAGALSSIATYIFLMSVERFYLEKIEAINDRVSDISEALIRIEMGQQHQDTKLEELKTSVSKLPDRVAELERAARLFRWGLGVMGTLLLGAVPFAWKAVFGG